MSANALCGAGQIEGVWSAPSRTLRLEKPCASAEMHGEERFAHPQNERRSSKQTCRQASRFETNDHVSRWNGLVPMPPFAAQVIAQALNAHENARPSAQLAYGRAAKVGLTRLLDDCV